jgi:DNA polymerase III epsilon subunit-like protein
MTITKTPTVVFIDFETNAIGKFRPPTQTPVQVSYSALGDKEIKTCYLSGATEISTSFNPLKLTVEFLDENGTDPHQFLQDFIAYVNEQGNDPEEVILVAHNANFDCGLLDIMMAQTGVFLPWLVDWQCTMQGSTEYCQLPPHKRSRNKDKYKYPRLCELADKLGITVIQENFHSADYDVSVLKQCWKIGAQIGVFVV